MSESGQVLGRDPDGHLLWATPEELDALVRNGIRDQTDVEFFKIVGRELETWYQEGEDNE